MPYKSVSDLPGSVQNALPSHARNIYKEAFNHAWKEYKIATMRREAETLEEISHKIAWSAVNNSYKKGTDGKWHEK
jgi:cation transport regulator